MFEVANKSFYSGKGLGMVGDYLNSQTGNTGIIYRTPKNYKRQSSARWGEHSIIGQKPVMEFIGPELEEITFELILDKSLGTNPDEDLKKLRNMRDKGEAVFFILGDFPVLDKNSRVCITSLNENLINVDKFGNTKTINVEVTLKEYVLRPEEMQQNENNTNKSSTSTTN